MRGNSAGTRLLVILFLGLALGAIWLLEPLIGFWNHFHLLGMQWPRLILLYLAFGLACSLSAGTIVTAAFARRAAQQPPMAFASYCLTGTLSLVVALISAPLIRRKLYNLLFPVSYAVIYPILVILGAIVTLKLAPRLMQPILSRLIYHPGGRTARGRLVALLVLVGLMIPLTVLKGEQARFRPSGGLARAQRQASPGTRRIRNLLLITIDALRADHLSTYGYERPTSPVIDSLAAESVLFENCFSQGNRTELSMGSMFTSLYPSMHSVRRWKDMASALPDEIETLAEAMRDAGLRTVGLMDNPYLKREWGLTQGFDRIEEFHYGYLKLLPVRCLLKLGLLTLPNRVPLAPVPRADLVVDKAIRRLHHLKDGPFYLYVHFMDVHHPYIPPKPYEAFFRTPGASPTKARSFWRSNWPVFNMLPSEEELLPRPDLLRVTDLYDAEIRYVDDQIGRLLKQLDLLDLSENTLVILTSDHGDEFLEHGDMLHKSQLLHDELTHVPLIIRIPGNEEPRRVDEIVRHIDLLPTLQEIFGLPIGGDVQGQSLRPLLFGSRGWVEVPAFSQSYEFIAVRTQTHKLMYDLPNGKAYCFDLLVDPAEVYNIYGQAAVCDSLEGALMEFLRKVKAPSDGDNLRELDELTREQLRSLGYM